MSAPAQKSPPRARLKAHERSPAEPAPRTELSVVIPVFNEEKNLQTLCTGLVNVLRRLGVPFEIIAVNDGSSDNSLNVLKATAGLTPELRIIDFRRNYGQTAAMM